MQPVVRQPCADDTMLLTRHTPSVPGTMHSSTAICYSYIVEGVLLLRRSATMPHVWIVHQGVRSVW
jgi:hypothetical protein